MKKITALVIVVAMMMSLATTASAEVDIRGLYPNMGTVTDVFEEGEWLTVTEVVDEEGYIWTFYDDSYEVGDVVVMIMFDGFTEEREDDEVLITRCCNVPYTSCWG